MAATRFLQIAVVVKDVDLAYKTFTELFGFEIENKPTPVTKMGEALPDMTINGKPCEYVARNLFFKAFNLEWEMMQPISGSPLADWLETHGPGIHHLAFLYEEGGERFIERYQEFTGKDVWMNGTAPSVGMDYNYLDLTDEIGFFVEAYREDLTPKRGLGINIDYKLEE